MMRYEFTATKKGENRWWFLYKVKLFSRVTSLPMSGSYDTESPNPYRIV